MPWWLAARAIKNAKGKAEDALEAERYPPGSSNSSGGNLQSPPPTVNAAYGFESMPQAPAPQQHLQTQLQPGPGPDPRYYDEEYIRRKEREERRMRKQLEKEQRKAEKRQGGLVSMGVDLVYLAGKKAHDSLTGPNGTGPGSQAPPP